MLGLLGVIWLVHRDFSLTWDESVDHFRRHAGERAWRFWFGGHDPTDALWDYGHNPSTSALYYAVWRALSAVGLATDLVDVWHALTAMVGLLGVALVPAVVRLLLPPDPGRGFDGPELPALAAAAVLACWPQWVGHGFGNFKDLPFAVAWLFATLTAMRLAQRPSPRAVIVHAVAGALLLIVRFGGLLFAPVSGLALGLALRRAPEHRRRLLLAAGAGVVLVFALHTLSYPFVLLDPVGGHLRLFSDNVDFEWPGTTLTAGVEHGSQDTPWSYLPTWLLVTLPEVCLLGLALWVVRRRGAPSEGPRADRNATGVFAAAILWPAAYVVVGRAPIYDGIRHVLFLTPLLIAAALVGLFGPGARLPRRVAAAVVALGVAWNAVETVRYHPLQLAWFNALIGGARGASDQFTVDYWATTARESALWVAGARAPTTVCVLVGVEESWQHYLPRPWRVLQARSLGECPSSVSLAYAPARNRLLTETRKAAGTRWTEAHRVERAGATLGIWFERAR